MAEIEELIANTGRAMEAVETELERTEDEKNVLKKFFQGVKALDAKAQIKPVPTAVQTPGIDRPPSNNGVEQVKNLYRETVMSVPHYEEEYGEPLHINMGENLGEDIVDALNDSSILAPQVKMGLLKGARMYIDRLENLREKVDSEYGSLREVRRGLKDIYHDVKGIELLEGTEEYNSPIITGSPELRSLGSAHQKIVGLESDLEELTTARMEDIDRIEENPLDRESWGFYSYLYQDIGCNMPALKDCYCVEVWLYQQRKRITRTALGLMGADPYN